MSDSFWLISIVLAILLTQFQIVSVLHRINKTLNSTNSFIDEIHVELLDMKTRLYNIEQNTEK